MTRIKKPTALIVDDFTISAGTLAEAAKVLVEKGAKRVFAAVTHGVFVEGSMDRIRNTSRSAGSFPGSRTPPILATAYLVGRAPHFDWYLVPITWCLVIIGTLGLLQLARLLRKLGDSRGTRAVRLCRRARRVLRPQSRGSPRRTARPLPVQ